MANFLEAIENYFRPVDERFTRCFEVEDISIASITALKRLWYLSYAPLLCSVYFVCIMIVEASAEFVGSAGLCLLSAIIMRQTSAHPKGRSFGHVGHMRLALTLFLGLTTAKGFAILYSTYDTCKMADEALGELECSALRWCTSCVIAIFGYILYVGMLVMSRLSDEYLILHCRSSVSRRTSKIISRTTSKGDECV